MDLPTKPLPSYLIQRYHGWKATTHKDNHAWYRRLVEEGQRPREMLISCCDSRVNVSSIFGAEAGEFFIHRNIASLVPPYEPDGDKHGTSAAIEYAVNVLRVSHLIVVGHSNCGGVAGCYEMCSGNAPELEKKASFVGRWMDILRPGFDRLDPNAPDAERRSDLEREAVLVSIENLMSFPFVADKIAQGSLSLHGLWVDIADGTLLAYDSDKNSFVSL